MDMNLNPDNAAKYTLELYWDYEIPVNISRICAVSQTMDVLMVDKDSLNGLDARLDFINGRWIAKIAKGFEQQRERFTLAHLYYCQIMGYGGWEVNSASFNFNNKDVRCENANRFAQSLLIPKLAVDFLIMKKKINDINQLAQAFAVSKQTMNQRLKQLKWLP